MRFQPAGVIPKEYGIGLRTLIGAAASIGCNYAEMPFGVGAEQARRRTDGDSE